MFYLFGQIDFLEWLYIYSREHDQFELDEIIPIFITISISLLVFSIRRIRELNRVLQETKYLSIRDHLTKLYNRRYIQDIYLREIERSIRKNKSLSILLIDIDNFKKINDIYGHSVGDEVLQEISKIMVTIARKSDITARWGGEEFLILCPETDLKEAEVFTLRLVESIDNNIFKGVGNVTVSIGVTNTSINENLETVVHRADEYLYQAKANGKNCYIAG